MNFGYLIKSASLWTEISRAYACHGNRIEMPPEGHGSTCVLRLPGKRVRQLFIYRRLEFIQNVKSGPTDTNPHFQVEGRCERGPIAVLPDGQVIASVEYSIYDLIDELLEV